MSYTADFDISHIVADVGESFTVSGVSKSVSDYGDATETYTAYYMSGVVQELSGDDDLVQEGIAHMGDIQVFVDNDETNASSALQRENYIHVTETISGTFKIANVIRNHGHWEVYAEKVRET